MISSIDIDLPPCQLLARARTLRNSTIIHEPLPAVLMTFSRHPPIA
jgi:hypothetical protein